MSEATTLIERINASGDLEVQVAFIRELAKTGSDEAIEFLELVLVPESADTGQRRGSLYEFMWSDWMDTGEKVGVEPYPNAPEPLRTALISNQTYSSHFDVDEIYGVVIRRSAEEMKLRKPGDDEYWAPLNIWPGNKDVGNFVRRCINYCKSKKSFGFVNVVERQAET